MARLWFTSGAHPMVGALAEALRTDGHEVFVCDLPINTPTDVRALLRAYGVPDGLIASEYNPIRSPIDGGDADEIARSVEETLGRAFLFLKHVGVAMTERRQGRIIFLSSIFADKPSGSCPSYSLSQGALQMTMKELALHYARFGVTVNMIKLAPAPDEDETFDSPLIRATYDMDTKTPTGRRVCARDALGAIEYLLSDMAENVNGADLRIDGGLLYYYTDRLFESRREADLV